MKEFYELLIGSLLHDIGKFYQRAVWDESKLSSQTLGLERNLCPTNEKGLYTHRHVLWTNEFFERYSSTVPAELNISRVANIASFHHLPNTPIEKIVQLADRLSASIDRKKGSEEDRPRDLKRYFLKSIFDEINIGKKISVPNHFYRLDTLDFITSKVLKSECASNL